MKEIQLLLNLSDMPEGHTGHIMPSSEIVNGLLDIYKNSQVNNILEFGFNTGWSSYIMFSYLPNVKITSIEIHKFDRAEQGIKIINEKFPERFQVIWQDSTLLYKEVLNKKIKLPFDKYDTAFIDGGHYPNIVDNDIKLSKFLGIKNFIFDDGDCPNILPAIQKHSDLKLIKKYPYLPLRKINNEYFVKKNKGWPIALHHYQT